MHSHHNRQDDNAPRVHIDEDGNIFIECERVTKKSDTHSEPLANATWDVTEQSPHMHRNPGRQPFIFRFQDFQQALHSVRCAVFHATSSLLTEGSTQYQASYREAQTGITEVKTTVKEGASTLWKFLTQPVWVMQKNKPAKEYSRMTLFTLDVVRFGGTFAAIFVALFVSLNYQSFWDIVSPHFDPLERSQSMGATLSNVDNALRDKLLRSPTLPVAGTRHGDLLSFLPDVGPPENRIIIPRLGVNIPLVTPSFDSLLKEDWEGVEKDIQDALQYGVVHYPGTARPGQAGNVFVTGHSSYYPWAPGNYKNIFARLHELSIGDEYWMYYGGDKHRYIIQGKKEVKPSDVSVLDQPVHKRMSTLMTCTPVGTTLRRLILTAQEIDPQTGIALHVGQNGARPMPKMRLESLPI